jgi:uncharacterized protein (UPF0276 family)
MSSTRLGVGMTYAAGLEPQLTAVSDLLNVIEVEPETFWLAAPRPLPGEARARHRIDIEALSRLAALPQKKLVHGVSLPVGSARAPDAAQVDLVAEICGLLGAVHASEHLAFNQARATEGPFATGFFLPPRQTREGVEAVAATVRGFAARLPVPFAFETGVNYLRPRADELPDGEFIAAVAERAGCGILLDLHNIWTNERNGRQPVSEFLAAIPLERVIELHVAGGFELDGYWLDGHSGISPPQVMRLLREVLPRLPNVRAVIFEMLPEVAEHVGVPALRQQLEQLHDIWHRYAPPPGEAAAPWPRRPDPAPVLASAAHVPSPEEWEDTLGALAAGRDPGTPLSWELREDRGLALYRTLIAEGRAGAIAGVLPDTLRLLLGQLGEPAVRELLGQFAAEQPASLFGANEALAFSGFLSRRPLALPGLEQVLTLERQRIIHYLEGHLV